MMAWAGAVITVAGLAAMLFFVVASEVKGYRRGKNFREATTRMTATRATVPVAQTLKEEGSSPRAPLSMADTAEVR